MSYRPKRVEGSAAFVEPMMRLPGRTVLEVLAILARPDYLRYASAVERSRQLEARVDELTEKVEQVTDLLNNPSKEMRFSGKRLLAILCILAQRKLAVRPVLTPQQYERRFVKLCDRMAAIISQTYIEMGEDARLADDEALMQLRDLLMDFDETVIVRNSSRRRRGLKRRTNS
jgi:hypothetical protein